MHPKIFLPVLSCLALTACFTRYTNTSSEQKASLEIMRGDAAKFGAMTYIDQKQCAGRLILLSPLDDPPRTFSVPANTEFSYTLSADLDVSVRPSGSGGSEIAFFGCNNTVTFIPKPNAQYQTRLRITPGVGCKVVLTETVDGERVEVPHTPRTYVTPLTASRPSCQ